MAERVLDEEEPEKRPGTEETEVSRPQTLHVYVARPGRRRSEFRIGPLRE
jgi:hypothetical protein